MAWSDAARRAAALVRKSRSTHKRYLRDTGFTSHGPSKSFFEPNYRKTLAQKIRHARSGNASPRLVNEGRDAAAKGAASTMSRNFHRIEGRRSPGLADRRQWRSGGYKPARRG